MTLVHYSTERRTVRLLAFWSGRLARPDLEENVAELLTRADCLIDGLEMLVPAFTDAQQRLAREAVVLVRKAAMVTHGAFVLEEQRERDAACSGGE